MQVFVLALLLAGLLVDSAGNIQTESDNHIKRKELLDILPSRTDILKHDNVEVTDQLLGGCFGEFSIMYPDLGMTHRARFTPKGNNRFLHVFSSDESEVMVDFSVDSKGEIRHRWVSWKGPELSKTTPVIMQAKQTVDDWVNSATHFKCVQVGLSQLLFITSPTKTFVLQPVSRGVGQQYDGSMTHEEVPGTEERDGGGCFGKQRLMYPNFYTPVTGSFVPDVTDSDLVYFRVSGDDIVVQANITLGSGGEFQDRTLAMNAKSPAGNTTFRMQASETLYHWAADSTRYKCVHVGPARLLIIMSPTHTIVFQPLSAVQEHELNVVEPLSAAKEHERNVVEPLSAAKEHELNVVEPLSAAKEHERNVVEPLSAAKEHERNVVEPRSSIQEHDRNDLVNSNGPEILETPDFACVGEFRLANSVYDLPVVAKVHKAVQPNAIIMSIFGDYFRFDLGMYLGSEGHLSAPREISYIHAHKEVQFIGETFDYLRRRLSFATHYNCVPGSKKRIEIEYDQGALIFEELPGLVEKFYKIQRPIGHIVDDYERNEEVFMTS
jgi:hypothetical protein